MSDFAHRPERPTWQCQADGDQWPCHLARKILAETFVGNGEALSYEMAQRQLTAAGDLGAADPASLYQRFVGWTEPTSVTCGRCGKAKHRVIPGLPPRLFPCRLGRLEPPS